MVTFFVYVNIQVIQNKMENTAKYTANNLDEFQKITEDFVSLLSPNSDKAKVLGLYGNLGAGKTTFTQATCRYLEISENITSPTFVIMKIYELTNKKFTHLIHIDAYRLEKSEELLRLGWNEMISDPKNLILIEWPEKVEDIMPEHTKIKLKTLENPDSREMEIDQN